ncbi:MAG: phage terminase small subunit P27 family [Bacillota bacterium]
MPRGGHNRKPTKLKVLTGTARRDRTVKNEPKPQPIAPKPPSWLPRQAKRFWKEHAGRLERLGLLTEVDGPAFALCAVHYAVAAEAAKALKEQGILVPDPEHPAGEEPALRKHPLLSVLRDHSAAFRAYSQLFGLSPSDRGRLDLPQVENEVDQFEEFLRRGQELSERRQR